MPNASFETKWLLNEPCGTPAASTMSRTLTPASPCWCTTRNPLARSLSLFVCFCTSQVSVRMDRSRFGASERAICVDVVRSTPMRRSFRQEVFGHVVDEGAQFRRAVLARRPNRADGSNVIDVFVHNLDQRSFRDLAAHGEVGNTRESDTSLGERHQRLYRRHSGRDGKFDIGVGP